MAQHNELGKRGEELAIKYLIKKGYKILEKNYRYRKAEIDIIASKNEKLIIIEVKTRSTDYFGAPEEFVNTKKIALLTLAANNYIETRNINLEVRFDIIAIIKNKIEHIKEAFLHY